MASLRAHFGAWLVRRRVKAPLAAAGSVEDVRRILGEATFPEPKDATFEVGRVGGIAGEWVQPASGEARHRLLYVHGGGFVACSPRTHRPVTGALARRGFSVFAPDYRLAPEHPFPAGLEDVVAAWTAFRASGPASLAGESAGGNLALALMLAARDRGIPLPSAACLFSPVTDLAAVDGSRISNGRRDAMFTARSIPEVAPLYVGDGDRRVPLASPVYGDPSGLPPLLFHVGDREVLRDDSIRMVERAKAAGVAASLRVFPVVAHAWQFADRFLPEATASLDEAASFLKRHAGQRETAI